MKTHLVSACLVLLSATAFADALPSDYVGLKYLRGTGTQYIDTKYCPGSSTRVDMRYRLNRTGGCLPFGTIGARNGQYYFVYFSGSEWQFYFCLESAPMKWSKSEYAEKLEDSEMVANDDGKFTLHGLTRKPNVTVTPFTAAHPAYVFARNDNGTASLVAPMDLYSLDIFENGELVRSFRPALRKADGVAGLWESVVGEFLTNSGTGAFERDGYIYVEGSERCGDPEPGYGLVNGREFGKSHVYVAPRVAGDKACAGWTFMRKDNTVSASGRGSSATLAFTAADEGGTLQWQWRDRTVRADVPAADYLLLDCLRSNGKQYVDSGCLLGTKSQVDIAFELYDAAGSGLPFGTVGQNEKGYFFLYDDQGKTWQFHYDNGMGVTTALVDGFHRFSFNNDGRVTMDGTVWTLPDATYEPSGSAFIFARNDQGKAILPCKMDLYGFDVYETNVLSRSFVPVMRKSDRVQGLYETETQTFLPLLGDSAIDGVVRVAAAPEIGQQTAPAYWDFVHGRTVGVKYTYAAPKTVGSLVCTGWKFTRLDGTSVRGSGNSAYLAYAAGDAGGLLEWEWTDSSSCGLPEAYLPLEYVRGTGTQYFDTGYTPGAFTRVDMRFKMNDASQWYLPFGVSGAENKYYFLFYASGSWSLYLGGSVPAWSTGAAASLGVHRCSFNFSRWYTTDQNLSHVSLFDEVTRDVVDYKQNDFTATGTLFVFARNDMGGNPAYPTKMDLYSFDIYEADSLVRSFVPALRKADNAVGVYERLTGTFSPSAGEDPFEPLGGYVKVEGLPTDAGCVDPAYGHVFGRQVGTEYVYTAPARFGDGDLTAVCEGWTFTRRDGTTTSGSGNEARLVFADGDNGGVLAWQWRETYGFRPSHYRSEITVTPGALGSGVSLTDFPVLVRVSPQHVEGFLYDQCAADGANVWFSSSPAGTDVLPCEVDDWDPTGVSTFWVKAASLTAATKIYMFWGGKETPARDTGAMWGDYAAVWHMSEVVDGGFADSTLHGNSLVPTDAAKTVRADAADARIGKAKAGEGSVRLGDYLGKVAGLNGGIRGRATISGWFHAPSLAAKVKGTCYPLSAQSGVNSLGWCLWGQYNGQFEFYRMGDKGAQLKNRFGTPDYRKGWVHLTIVSDDSRNWTYGYVNGSRMVDALDSGVLDTVEGEALELPMECFDEVRLRPSVSPADWVQAEYAQGVDGAFLRAGPAFKLAVNKKGAILLLQ